MPYEGVIAALGVGGLELGFAARDAVSNFIGAGILMADRPFAKGDLIEANGQMSVVEEVGLRSTRLRTVDVLVVVPNSKISDQQVNNWGLRRSRRVVMTLGATCDTPRIKLDAFVKALK
jgi:MscS family membrane protein